LACDTFAKLITEALMGLGMPSKELVEVEDAARAVIHSLALLQQHATYSPQNLNLIPYDWEPSARSEAITGIPDVTFLPAWVQRKWSSNTNPSQDYWVDVRVCNLAELESARLRGEWNRCAFNIQNGQMFITFSYDPRDYSYRQHRLWYSPDVALVETFNDTVAGMGFNQNFFPLISGMAELELIPTMRIRAAALKEPNKELISAWDKREEYLAVKMEEWKDRFKHFVYGERGNRKGGRRRSILPRGMRI
jgi:hypothetical protein